MAKKGTIAQVVKKIKESCDNYLMYADDDDPVYEKKMIDSIIEGARELVMVMLYMRF